MKKLFLSLSILCGLMPAVLGQIEKGRYLVGGTAGLSNLSFSGSEGSITTVFFSPSAGLFIADGVAVGTSLALSGVFSDGNASGFIGIGPFARYYFANYLFAQLALNLSAGLGDANTSTLAISPGIGYSIFLNKQVAIEPIFTVNFQTPLNEGSNVTQIGLIASFQVFLDKLGKAH